MYWRVKELLDRQAAITSAEWCWSNDALEEELTRKEAEVAELRAELETYRKYADQGKCDNCGTVESETSKVPELDTREQLEADLHQYANPGDYENTLGSFWEKKILSFLDRQAAITRRKTLLENPLHNNPYVGLVRGKQWARKQASDYYCGKCGYPVTDHDSYCPECGGAFHKATNKPNSQFDVLKTAENAENDTSKNEIHNFDDSREQLEADVHSTIFQWGWDSEWSRNEQRSNERMAMLWLDRQAAITERDLCVDCDWPLLAVQPDEEAYDRIAELTAERDRLADERYRYKLQCERWESKVAMLEADCDHLKKVVHIQAESFRKLEVELTKMKEKRNADDE